MAIKLKKQAASTVQTPASTHVQLFMDSDGQPKIKDDTATITELSQSNFVTLNEQPSAPPTLANKVRIYSKDVAGISEFFVLDDQGQEVQITNNGAINVVSGGGTDTTVTSLATSVSPAADTSTYCFSPFTTITLPDGNANLGKRLSVTLGQPGGRILLTNPYLGGPPSPTNCNLFVNETGQYVLTTEQASVDPGVYEFRSIDFSAAGPGLVLWSIRRLAGAYGRKSGDTTHCLEGDFPAGYVQTPISATGGWYISGTGTTPATPVKDDTGAYNVGELVLAPFETNWPGLYRVVAPTGGVDWKWEMIESPGANPVNATEYRITLGEAYGARKFHTNNVGSPPNPGVDYLLEPAPCQVWPYDGTLLDGTGGGTHAHTNDKLLVGKTNMIDTSGGGPLAMTLVTPASFQAIIGERLAIKVGSGALSLVVVTVTLPIDQTMENPNNSYQVENPTTNLAFGVGGYAEWQLDSTGVWRSLNYIQGFTGA
jgi:hypothetical protein